MIRVLSHAFVETVELLFGYFFGVVGIYSFRRRHIRSICAKLILVNSLCRILIRKDIDQIVFVRVVGFVITGAAVGVTEIFSRIVSIPDLYFFGNPRSEFS